MLVVSILGNALAGKGVIWAVEGTIRAGESIIRIVKEF